MQGTEKVSCLERCPHFKGVLIEGYLCIFCRRVPLYISRVSL